MRRLWTCVAMLSWSTLAQPALAQRTWIVDPRGGAGVDYTDIPPAIAAASPGDRVLVRAYGNYSGFVLDRGIDLEAPNAAAVPWFAVRNVPAGQHASVEGFLVWVDFWTGLYWGGGWVEVASCQGAVRLRHLAIRTGRSMSTLGPVVEAGLRVQDCAQVLALDCQVGPDPDTTSSWPPGGNGLVVRRAAVSAQRCSFTGAAGYGGRGIGSPTYPGAHGALVTGTGAALLAASTTVIGGPGGAQGASGANTPQQGGHGVAGDATAVFMADSVLTRGEGGWAAFGRPPGPPGSAADGPHLITDDCTLTGAMTGGAGTIPALTWIRSPGDAQLGQPVSLDLFGATNTVVLLMFDRDHAHLAVPGLSVPLLLQNPIPLQVVSIGQNGQLPWTLNLPADPLWQNQCAFFQGVALPPSGPLVTLTNLGDLRLR